MRRLAAIVLAWAGVLLLLAFGAAIATRRSEHREVLVVNPLDETVSVQFGDEARDVGAEGGTARLWVRAGVHEVKVTESRSGRLLDDHRIVVPPEGAGAAIYSVLGAAPLYRIDVRSAASVGALGVLPVGGGRASFDAFAPLVGARLHVLDAEVAFDRTTESLRPGWWGGPRTYVQRWSGGWNAGRYVALTMGANADEPRAIVSRLRRAIPDDVTLAWAEVVYAAAAEGHGPAVALAEEAQRLSPSSVEAIDVWEHFMRTSGRTAELRARALAMAADAPRSTTTKELLLLVLPRAGAVQEARSTAAAVDPDLDLLPAAAYVLLQAGRAAEAVELYRALPSRDDPQELLFPGALVRALLQTGDPGAAAALALQVAQREHADVYDVVRYLRVAAIAGASPEVDPQAVLAAWSERNPARAQLARAWAGLTPRPAEAPAALPEDPIEATGLLLDWAMHDPDEALALCRAGRPGFLVGLPWEFVSVLAVEAYRTGDRDLFERLRWSLPLSAGEIAAYVDRGVAPEDGWRLGDADRAALALARERTLRASGAAVPRDVSRAARGDPLGVSTLIAERWPAPRAARPPVVLVLQPER